MGSLLLALSPDKTLSFSSFCSLILEPKQRVVSYSCIFAVFFHSSPRRFYPASLQHLSRIPRGSSFSLFNIASTCNTTIIFYGISLPPFIIIIQARLKGEHANASSPFIAAVNLVEKESIYGYSGMHKTPFLLIVTSNPTYLNTAKRVLENGFSFGGNQAERIQYSTFESNLPFIMRFMVDTKVPFFRPCFLYQTSPLSHGICRRLPE